MLNYIAADTLLKDRVILITGAGDGIGRAAAMDCARLGATVILLGRTLEKLESVSDEIDGAGYGQPAIYPLDLRTATDEDYQELADVLNHAGFTITYQREGNELGLAGDVEPFIMVTAHA